MSFSASAGWGALVRSAEETEAWLVGPLYCFGWVERHAMFPIEEALNRLFIPEKFGQRH